MTNKATPPPRRPLNPAYRLFLRYCHIRVELLVYMQCFYNIRNVFISLNKCF